MEAVAHLRGRFDDRRERHVRSRVEVEDKTTGNLRSPRLAIPGMEADGADLGNRREAFYAVDLEIGLTITEHGHQLQKIGCPGHGVSLEKLLSANPVRRPDDEARPPFDMIDQPWDRQLRSSGPDPLCDPERRHWRLAKAACPGSRSRHP